jgi:murein DD-endopeptidase MepM/ murein hydrolase activator NlpD
MRFLVSLVFLLIVAAAGAWYVAGLGGGPVIEIHQPATVLGQSGALDVTIDAPGGAVERFEAYIEQQGRRMPLATAIDAEGLEVTQEGPDRLRVKRPIARRALPDLQSGDVTLTVIASRSALYGWRTLEHAATRDLRVRLEPPRVAVVSTHHFVNHGGSEMVVLRATPPDVESGVRVGEVEYPSYPASDAAAIAGVQIDDPALRVAFFALLHDQDLNTPIAVFARDEAGNTARADFAYRVFPKPFRRSQIPLEDRFLERVVPAILNQTDDIEPEGSTLERFLAINGELRQKNAEQIAAFREKTSPRPLFTMPFQQLAGSKVESAFADQRTYYYQGREVDRQIHLGFDLSTTANAPIVASNRGTVVHADFLGIYGNTVIVDHGMGLQSLYAHLSSFDALVGGTVEKGEPIGRSGMTGLAGGDHLHFTMLLQGQAVTPIEWWDPKWFEDRVLRKLREAAR